MCIRDRPNTARYPVLDTMLRDKATDPGAVHRRQRPTLAKAATTETRRSPSTKRRASTSAKSVTYQIAAA
eukprot:4704974-Alexandrium_andersonii.AAC.1